MTHTLAGAASGAAGYPGWGRRGAAAVVIAANLPELERLFALGSAAAWVQVVVGRARR